LVEDDEVDVMNIKEHSKNNIKNEVYVAGNGVDVDMLRTVIDPLPKIIILDINIK
jgi:hypothetical protein